MHNAELNDSWLAETITACGMAFAWLAAFGACPLPLLIGAHSHTEGDKFVWDQIKMSWSKWV